MEKHIEVERSIYKKYRKDIWKKFIAGINEYQLIKEGDCIAVCISGGKDSMLLAKCIQHLQKHSDFPFEAKYLVLNPGYSPENRQRIIDNAALLDVPIQIFDARIFDYVVDIENSPCYMCASLLFLTGLKLTRVTENMLQSLVSAGLHSRHSLVLFHAMSTAV